MMLSLFSRKTFGHGVHPPESKEATRGLAIRQFPFAPLLQIPLVQHLGKPAIPVVREDQEVTRGQLIGKPDGFMSVAMHAPASGRVRRVGLMPSITGQMVPGVYLEPFPSSSQEVIEGSPTEASAPKDQIIDAIQSAGIVGLGGAAFPTHVKLCVPEGKSVDTLIINGVECEPFLTTDHRVMLEQREDVYEGIRYVMTVSGAERAVIAIEANKLDAAGWLQEGLPEDLPLDVEVLPVKYPQGAEKMLVTALLGRQVPSRGLPVDVGALCINVATTAEIGRLLPHGRGIQERVITITGPGVSKKGNYRIPIGTPLRFIMEEVQAKPNISRIFMGGPMMGPAASTLDIPVVKGTSGVVAFTENETKPPKPPVEHACIRCGRCVEACPMFLNPSELGLLAKNEEYHRMADDHHLMDCFECGSCSFVCPSNIPLVQHFRMAKASVRKAAAS